jgi:hypothetical protein
MIPYEVDPSLHTAPREPLLDDGFSPPASEGQRDKHHQEFDTGMPPVESWLWEKSGF